MSLSTTILGPRVSITTTGTNDPAVGHFEVAVPMTLSGAAAITAANVVALSVPEAGTDVTGIYSSVLSVDFGATGAASGTTSLVTVGVTGAVATSAILVTPTTAAGVDDDLAVLSIQAFSSVTAGEITLVASSTTALAADAQNQNIRITVINF